MEDGGLGAAVQAQPPLPSSPQQSLQVMSWYPHPLQSHMHTIRQARGIRKGTGSPSSCSCGSRKPLKLTSPQSWSLINFFLLGHKSCFLLLLNTIPQILPSSSWLAQPGHSAHLSLLPSLSEATAGNADQHPHTLTIWGSSCRGHTGKGWGRRGDGSPGINSSMKTEFPRTGGRGTKKQSSLIEISHGQGSAAPPLPCLLALGLLLILV